MTVLLTIVTWTMTDYGNYDIFFTCWTMHTQILHPLWISDHGWSYSTVKAVGNFQTVSTQETQTFQKKIYKLYYMSGYTYDICVTNGCLGKDTTPVTIDITATCKTVKPLTRKVEGHGYKPHMDNLFLSPDLSHNLTKLKINYWRTVIPNIKRMPWKMPQQNKKLNQADIHSRPRQQWSGETDMYTYWHVHRPPTNDNFYDEHGNVMKPRIIQD
jgi:hypothetical protein